MFVSQQYGNHNSQTSFMMHWTCQVKFVTIFLNRLDHPPPLPLCFSPFPLICCYLTISPFLCHLVHAYAMFLFIWTALEPRAYQKINWPLFPKNRMHINAIANQLRIYWKIDQSHQTQYTVNEKSTRIYSAIFSMQRHAAAFLFFHNCMFQFTGCFSFEISELPQNFCRKLHQSFFV